MLRCLYLLIGLLLVSYSLLTINESSFSSRLDGKSVKNSLLYNLAPGEHNVELILTDLPKEFIFRVDDCLKSMEINGSPVNGFNFPYCDWNNTASISFKDVPSLPLNKITLVVVNNDGPGNFIPLIDLEMRHRLTNYLIFGLGFFLLVFSILRNSWSINYFILLLIGLLSKSAVAAVLPLDFRSSDFHGHVEHVAYVFKNWIIPPVSECWECYQPPVYYFLNALFALRFKIDLNDFSGLGLFPLFLSFFSCVVTILLFRTWVPNRGAAFLLIPFLLFPGTLATEISFNNDSLVTLISLLLLLLGSIWFKTSNESAFWLGAIILPIGILSKLSIFATAVWWFCLLVSKKSYRKAIFSVLVAAIIAGPYFIYRSQTENKVEMIGNIGNLNSDMRIEITPKTFYSLDIQSMIENPFADPWIEGFHRHSFAEYAFLSGVFFEARRLALTPAQISIALLIFSLFVSLTCFLLHCRSIYKPNWPIFAAILLQIIALALNVIVHPFACCANFRFIAPIGVLLGIAFAAIMERQSRFVKYPLLSTTTLGMLFAWFAILTSRQ